MDPYVEDPEIWSDFHSDLAGEIRARLNPLMQPRYVARLTPRVVYEVVEVSTTKLRGVRPDVAVWQAQPPGGHVAEAVKTITPAPVQSSVSLEVPLRLMSVEVRTTDTLELVTAIEILSPVNKRAGHDAHRDYLRKRRDLLRSAAHLLEIDLLRGGERPPLEEPVPRAPYYVTLSRAERRPTVEVWPIQLSDELPVLPVPLLEPDPDVPLDLGAAVAAVYERGGYASLIDYHRPPPPPDLSEAETRWLDEHLRKQNIR
jgi:hypothetical protein